MKFANRKQIPILVALLILFTVACNEGPVPEKSSTTAAPEHRLPTVSKQDITFALTKAERVSKKLQNTIVVLGDGLARNLSLRFACRKDEDCDIPNKLFGKDLEMLPDAEREFVGGLVTDLLGTPIEEIPNFGSFRLLNRKEKVVVILKFTKRSFPLQVTVENPEGGSVQVNKEAPCGSTACASFQIPFDDYANLTAVPLPDWDVESWSIVDAIKVAEAIPDLRSILVRQTKNGLKVRIKFRRKPPVTYFSQTEIAAMERGPALVAPNQIDLCTVEDLEKIRANPAGNFRLVCDIDLAARPWNVLPQFSGSLDGMNHKISNLKVTTGAPTPCLAAAINTDGCLAYGSQRLGNSSTQRFQHGFFGIVTTGARIANLTLDNAVVEATSAHTDHVGILAGWLLGSGIEISYVNVSGKVTADLMVGQRYVVSPAYPVIDGGVAKIGAIAGYVTQVMSPRPRMTFTNAPKLSHVKARAIINVTQPQGTARPADIGGLVGNSYIVPMAIEFSEFFGTVNASPESSAAVGGLAGRYSGTIHRSKFSGVITGLSTVGGLVGSVSDFSSVAIFESRSSGEVRSGLSGIIGGLVGTNTSYDYSNGITLRIERSYSDAEVGLWISPQQAELIKNNRSKNGGRIPGEQYVGGLVGSINSQVGVTIRDSYYAGTLHGGTRSGGIIGSSYFPRSVSCSTPSLPQLQNVYFNGRTVFAMDSVDPLSLKETISRGGSLTLQSPVVTRSAVVDFIDDLLSVTAERCPADYYRRQFINAYWNDSLTDEEDDFAVGLSAAQMNDKSRFVGFDFINVWAIDPRGGAPRLRWQP